MFDFETIPFDRKAKTDHLKVPVFAMNGSQAGPRLVVMGDVDLMRELSERFWDLPGLESIRGDLVLRQDDQDPVFDLPDDVLQLKTLNITAAYYQVLGRMTALGMISGRGVPVRWVA